MLINAVLLILTSSVAFGISIIDSGNRIQSERVGGESDSNFIDVSHEAECSNLTPELLEEIKSHQTIVNEIVRAIVNGNYSGDTWNA